MKQLKDIIMLPTKEANIDTIVRNTEEGDLKLSNRKFKNAVLDIPQHLYILSTEQIKEGDWIILDNTKYVGDIRIVRASGLADKLRQDNGKKEIRKIIATTDKSLRGSILHLYKKGLRPAAIKAIQDKEKLPQIPEQFIKLYVEKQGKINQVLVEYETIPYGGEYDQTGKDINPKYKLLINPDNTINISLEDNKMYTRDEVETKINNFYINLCARNGLIYIPANIKDWIKDNL